MSPNVVLLFTATLIVSVVASPISTDNQIELDRDNSKVKLCPPDHLLVGGEQCKRLRMSISDLIRDILENSESSLSLANFNLEEKSASPRPPAQVPVSDLFIQNLAVQAETNMSSCLALSACSEHCLAWPTRSQAQQAHEASVIDRFILSPALKGELAGEAKSKDDQEGEDENTSSSAPDFVMTIMLASQKGIGISGGVAAENIKNLTSVCKDRCMAEFNPQTSDDSVACSPMHYDYTVRINAIYRSLVEVNTTLVADPRIPAESNLTPEALYYHYSMRFLDLANLTTCFAQVSCENTCEVYKSASAAGGDNPEGAELAPPPEPSSPYLKKGDPRPAAVGVIHEGTSSGYKLAFEGGCQQCADKYRRRCTRERYMIARASLAIFG